MNPASQSISKAGSAVARDRLGQYRRYAELVAQQEVALDAEDLPRFEAIAHEIASLQQEIGGATSAGVFKTADNESVDTEVQEATDVLTATIARSERVHSRLASMRQAGVEDIRDVIRRRPQARRYVTEAASQTGRVSSLDVTF